MRKQAILALAALLSLAACNNYGLDDKIKAALGNGGGGTSGGSLTFTNVQGGTFTNGALNYTLSNAVKLTATVSLNGSTGGMNIDTTSLPNFINATISGTGELQISTKSNPASLPTNITSSQLSPTMRFTLSSGSSASVPLNLGIKRAFVSSLTSTGSLTGGTNFVGSCSGAPEDKVNCGCQNRAAAANLKNSDRYRGWISHPTSHARCNITKKGTLGGILSVGGVFVTNPGSGYSSPPSVTITGGGCSGVVGQAIIANGGVVEVQVTTPGSSCGVPPTVSFTPSQGGITALAVLGGCNVSAMDGGPWFTTGLASTALIAYDMGAVNNGSLFSGIQPLINAINFTEFGNIVGGEVLTATQGTGNPTNTAADHFMSWTSVAAGGFKGSTTSTAPQWTNSSISGASDARGFYCFETD